MGNPPSTQWAAVITWFSLIILPPQIWEPKFLKDICQGNSSRIGNKYFVMVPALFKDWYNYLGKLRFGASDPPMIFESANRIAGFKCLAYAKLEIAKITKSFIIM